VNATVTCSIGSLAVNAQAVVKINVTPTVAGSLTNSGTLQTNGVALVATSTPAVTVTDFTVSVSPSTNTVAAGDSATYEVKVGVPRGQSNFFPNSVSLACSAGLPTGAACTFSTNPLTMTNTSPVSSTVTITTTARPVSTGQLRGFRYWYAVLFPITGLTLFGLGAGARRRRKYLVVLFGFVLIGLCGLQLACNSGSGTTTPQTGTPAGTYPITMTGTSGAAHTARLTLVVQ
jgi:hypothetical protein